MPLDLSLSKIDQDRQNIISVRDSIVAEAINRYECEGSLAIIMGENHANVPSAMMPLLVALALRDKGHDVRMTFEAPYDKYTASLNPSQQEAMRTENERHNHTLTVLYDLALTRLYDADIAHKITMHEAYAHGFQPVAVDIARDHQTGHINLADDKNLAILFNMMTAPDDLSFETITNTRDAFMAQEIGERMRTGQIIIHQGGRAHAIGVCNWHEVLPYNNNRLPKRLKQTGHAMMTVPLYGDIFDLCTYPKQTKTDPDIFWSARLPNISAYYERDTGKSKDPNKHLSRDEERQWLNATFPEYHALSETYASPDVMQRPYYRWFQQMRERVTAQLTL